ncbi:hypothetical protein BDW67DRAFT_55967 [Aspergillus spinulosporus]
MDDVPATHVMVLRGINDVQIQNGREPWRRPSWSDGKFNRTSCVHAGGTKMGRPSGTDAVVVMVVVVVVVIGGSIRIKTVPVSWFDQVFELWKPNRTIIHLVSTTSLSDPPSVFASSRCSPIIPTAVQYHSG